MGGEGQSMAQLIQISSSFYSNYGRHWRGNNTTKIDNYLEVEEKGSL